METASLEHLPNLGEVSCRWLRAAGIADASALKDLGAVRAYATVIDAGFKPSLNLLYSLQGAIVGLDWREVKRNYRSELLTEWEAMRETHPTSSSNQR